MVRRQTSPDAVLPIPLERLLQPRCCCATALGLRLRRTTLKRRYNWFSTMDTAVATLLRMESVILQRRQKLESASPKQLLRSPTFGTPIMPYRKKVVSGQLSVVSGQLTAQQVTILLTTDH